MDTLIIAVVNVACVTAVVAYILVHTSFHAHILNIKRRLTVNLMLVAIFSAFSIWGMMNRIEVAGGLLGLSHTGQIVGGLIAGPFVGTGAGIIMGAYRYSLGGLQAVPSTIITILPGVLAGLYYLYKRGRAPGTLEAAIFTAVYEIIARGIALGLSPDFEKALIIQKSVAVPTIVGHTIAVGLFIFLIHKLVDERLNQAKKERMEGELSMARSIQLNLVPRTFPPYPDVKEFDVAAMLQPAREVGGDLYDFFFVGPDHFYVIIGDVSGKGVPAALFMSSTRALIRAYAKTEVSADHTLNQVNQELAENNDTAMFVTLFLGILNIHTGELVYANAGHNLPYVCRNTARIETVSGGGNAALGVLEDGQYIGSSITLSPGDQLVLYTDGVTEAMNRRQDFYGEERLEQLLGAISDHSSTDIVTRINEDVVSFANGADQSDDITLLVLKFNGPEVLQ
jgi:sigma-B regulation protein RsbU (phosphoserine phosphatase)